MKAKTYIATTINEEAKRKGLDWYAASELGMIRFFGKFESRENAEKFLERINADPDLFGIDPIDIFTEEFKRTIPR